MNEAPAQQAAGYSNKIIKSGRGGSRPVRQEKFIPDKFSPVFLPSYQLCNLAISWRLLGDFNDFLVIASIA